MASLTKELWDNFKEATSIIFDINKERPVVKLLNTTVGSLENILKGIDVFLKSHGVNVEKVYDKSKDKAKSIVDSAKDKLKEAKEKGYINTAKDIKSNIKDKFKGFFEKDTGPPEENKVSIMDGIKNFFSKDKEESPEVTENVDIDKQLNTVGNRKGLFKKTKWIATLITIDGEGNLVKLVNTGNNKEYLVPEQAYKKMKFIMSLDMFNYIEEHFDLSVDEEEKKTSDIEDKVEESSVDEPKDKEEGSEKKKGIVSKLMEKTSKVKDKITGLFNKDSWTNKSEERSEERKKEVEEEKKAVQERSKKDKKDGWLGKLLSGIMSLGGFIVNGLGSVISTVAPMIVSGLWSLGGFLLKGLGTTLFNLVPGLSGGIARATQYLAGKGIGLSAKGGWEALKLGARSALPMAGQALGAVARGAAMLATGPVGWIVAAGTVAYAGYKLYKYLKRNDVSDDIYGKLTKLRLHLYGFNDINKQYYSKLFDLEMMMKDYTKFTNYQVQISKLNKDDIDKILDIFGVSREEKDKYKILNTWFMKRFIPAYKSFMAALWSVNSNYFLDTIDKLKDDQLQNFITKFNVPGSIYEVTEIPVFDNPKTPVTKEDVDTLIKNISNEINNKIKSGKSDVQKAADQNKQEKSKQTIEAEKEKQVNKESIKSSTALDIKSDTTGVPKKESDIKADKDKEPISPDQEGETKPKDTATGAGVTTEASSKAAGKLNIAQGQLTPGGMSLEGISTKLDKSKIYNLDPNVRNLFTGMAKEYNSLTGKNIQVNQAFRSYEDQAALYKSMPDKAAKPGNSTHEYGLGIDVSSVDVAELEKMGLLRKYGFSLPIGKETWHMEPIGVSLNPTLAKKDSNFRFKAIEASPGKGGGGYGLDPSSENKRRNIPFQTSIYNANSENPIDIEKMKSITKEPELSPTLAVTDKPKETTSSATSSPMAGSESVEVSPNKSGISEPSKDVKITEKAASSNETGPSISPTPTSERSSSKVEISKSPDQEGEPKPSSISSNIPKTKTPVKNKPNEVGIDLTDNTNKTTIGPNMDLGKFAQLGPEEAIKQAAKMTGMNEKTMLNFAKLESSMNPNAKAKTSSASGLYQITDGTWKELVQKHGSKYGITSSSDKNNPFYNSIMGAEYAKENLSKLKGYKEAGVEEDTALYMAHFLGLGGANKFFGQFSKDPNAPVQTAVSEASYKANRSLMEGKTVTGLLETMDKKMGNADNIKTASYKTSSDKSTPSEASSSFIKTSTTSKPQSTATNSYSDTSIKSTGNLSSTSPVTDKTIPNKSITAPTPSISSSPMSITSPSPVTSLPKPTPETTSPVNYGEMFNTSKMENILTNQLDTLTKIAGILSSMDGKFDGLKTTQQPGKENSPNSPSKPGVSKPIPNSIIDLSRKALKI